jgi:hypothetical protein
MGLRYLGNINKPGYNPLASNITTSPNTVQYQGVFTLQQQAQAITTGQWATDPLFDYSTLLLQADNIANGSQNNTFLDSSSNNFTITRNGNTTQGAFTPFSATGWGNYFDGSSSISYAANADFNFGTGNFTIEGWAYITANSTSFMYGTGGSGQGDQFIYDSSAGQFAYYNGTSWSYSPAVAINTWNHFAAVRSGTTITVYVNGIGGTGVTSSASLGSSTNAPYTGRRSDGTYSTTGYVSNLRVIKGQALYTGSFTPATSALNALTVGSTGAGAASSITGTVSLVTCQSNRFVDNSTTPKAVSVATGTPSVQAFSPFAPQYQWTSDVIGGSGYSDGTGDYLTIASNANLTLGSSDFTIELWWYPLAFSADGEILTMASTGGTNRCYAMYTYNSNGTLGAFAGTGGSSWDIVSNLNMGTAVRNAWNHMAFTRSGSTFSTYLNGVRVATTTATGTLGSSGLGVLANNSGTSQAPNSYISGVRTIKGTALYTGTTYTIPTSPPTAVANTNLLLNFTNAGIYDGTMKNNLETVGNASVSTSVVKYGSGSMYFDGTGDYLKLPSNALYAFGTGAYTIEFWIYPSSLAAGSYHVIGANATNGIVVIISNAKVALNKYGVGDVLAYNTALTTSTWSHVAVVRESTGTNQTKIYVNGTSVATGTDSNDWTVTTNFGVGANTSDGSQAINGYLDDLRVTKGIARYTQNFIPPSVALPRQ